MLAIQTTVIVFAIRRAPIISAPATATSDAAARAPFAGGGPGSAPDISRMTPREQADRLFDRIARASESGDTAQVQFFAPMALQAYANLGALDSDARLHVGLIQLAAGNPAAAAAQGDTILRGSRTHLFGFLLEARAAEAQGNTARAREAFRGFLDNYAPERAKNLPEYQQHTTVLTESREDAQRAMAASTRP